MSQNAHIPLYIYVSNNIIFMYVDVQRFVSNLFVDPTTNTHTHTYIYTTIQNVLGFATRRKKLQKTAQNNNQSHCVLCGKSGAYVGK